MHCFIPNHHSLSGIIEFGPGLIGCHWERRKWSFTVSRKPPCIYLSSRAEWLWMNDSLFQMPREPLKARWPSCHHHWLSWDFKSKFPVRKCHILITKPQLVPSNPISYCIGVLMMPSVSSYRDNRLFMDIEEVCSILFETFVYFK